jgi:hypothetical protein
MLAGGGFRSFWAVSFASGRDGSPQIGIPRKLFDSPAGFSQVDRNVFSYAVASGGRFLATAFDEPPSPSINLITNWWKLAGRK